MKCMAALVEKEKLEGKGVSESQTSLISSFNSHRSTAIRCDTSRWLVGTSRSDDPHTLLLA